MEKSLLKLALAGLAAGLCISAQSRMGGEIAMTKCSKSPPQNQEKSGYGGAEGEMQKDDSNSDELSSCGSSPSADEYESSSCSNTCGGQGDQSSQGEKIREARKIEAKRLSAAKTVIGEEELRRMGK